MSAPAGGAGDPSMRASDAERQAVVERLNGATGEGRLTLAEFSERAAAAFAATTRADLEPLLSDLPVAAGASVVPETGVATALAGPGSPPSGAAGVQLVPLGAIKRSGRWRLDRVSRLKVTVGTVKLDLRGAELAAHEVDLHVETVIGSVKVWVPTGVRVVVDGSTTIGTRTIEEDSASGPGPMVRLHVDTRIGTVKVNRV